MKLLLENWRKYLLTEGAKTIEDLLSFKDEESGEDLKIYIRARPRGHGSIEITYASVDVNGKIYDLGYNDAIHGEVEIVSANYGHDDIGPCDGAYQVKWSTATEGWGPLLYDVAIEYATMHGNGLISDRDEVSDEARAVWDYYLGRRSDVSNSQLDDLADTLTPDIAVDNCAQDIIAPEWEHSPPDWRRELLKDSSLSKRYTKEPTTIDRLKELGRYIDET